MRVLLPLLFAFAPLAAPAEHAPACDAGAAVLSDAGAGPPQVSTEELRGILEERSAAVFDVRPPLEFATGHIPGARNVAQKPGSSAALYVSDAAEIGRLVDGRKDAPIVLYCNGPYCGKSKRVAADLVAAGYTNVRRYQLGIPVWRALGGVTQIEPVAARRVLDQDRTAVWLDARPSAQAERQPLPRAKRIGLDLAKGGKDSAAVQAAKNDGTLPMEDHNTRIVVVAAAADEARALAEAIAREAFHNVAFYAGDVADLTGRRAASAR